MASSAADGSGDEPPRSDNTSRVGILFVHGVGSTAHSDTLIDFGESFAGWVARWQRAQEQEPAYGRAALNFTPYDAGSDHPLPYAELHLPAGPQDVVPPTWVCAEAWWASSDRPLPFGTMLWWSARYLGSLIFHLAIGLSDRATRLQSGNESIHDGNLWYRVVDLLTCIGHIIGYLVLGLAGYAVLLPIIVIAQIPYPPFQNFIVVTFFRIFLQYNASELRVYYEDEIQAANIRRRIAEGVAWLTKPARCGGGDCKSVTIIAHSGGAWAAHGMLTDDSYLWARARVRKFITLGNGLNKIWELAPATLTRLYKPVEGDIYWLDFWGSYDPVPAGWLTPPRQGRWPWQALFDPTADTRPWPCIYDPNRDLATQHNLEPRPDPMPPFQAAKPDAGNRAPPVRAASLKPLYWPESVRVVNRMDALTDHGGYFTNDEEVLRRVACEIQSDVYTDSMFWLQPPTVLASAVPERRNRVGMLANARLLALVGGVVAVTLWTDFVAAYLADVGPVASLLSGALEVHRLLLGIPDIGTPAGDFWSWIVMRLLWLAGAAVASLASLIPYEILRAVWELHDLSARNALLRRASPRQTTAAAHS